MRRDLDPTGNRRQRRAHEHRGRQQADRAQHRTEEDCAKPVSNIGHVQVAQCRENEQDEDAECADSELQPGVDAKRVPGGGNDTREQEAPCAHAAHERGQQHTQRHRRRPNHQLHQLKPDDLVDQRGASAAHEQKEDTRQESRRCNGLNRA